MENSYLSYVIVCLNWALETTQDQERIIISLEQGKILRIELFLGLCAGAGSPSAFLSTVTSR